MADIVELSAQARKILQPLHGLDDVIVKFQDNESEFKEDHLSKGDYDDEGNVVPGHFQTDKKMLTLNLSRLIPAGEAFPDKLDDIEDFRKFPILAGVAAHESGHARWSLYDELPDSIPNPDFDPGEEEGPGNKEWFPVSGNGQLAALAEYLEEPRIERLGIGNFTKTWRRAMQFSAGHLIMESVDQMSEGDTNALDQAARLAIIVGGRVAAGTLGTTPDSRKAVTKILDSAQGIIERAVANFEPDQQTVDPYHVIMGITRREVFNNDHENATSHLESARQILAIIHPETKDDPDKDPGDGEGDGADGESGASGGALAGLDPDGSLAKALAEMKEAMGEDGEALAPDVKEYERSEEEDEDDEPNTSTTGHGSVLYNNPHAPKLDHYEDPSDADRDLYKRARDWMQAQIIPTVSQTEFSQWLPGGGARLNVRNWIRDNLRDNLVTERTDWDRVSETVRPAPPVKVGIMLDGSGSMGRFARASASIAWAASNAAADLPESRTVSVVYGDAAAVTQQPGHAPARKLAVSKTNHGTEDFVGAARIVEDALWLGQDVEDGEQENVLIIIVSDIAYGGYSDLTGESQIDGFQRIYQEWILKGYNVVIVGPDEHLYYASRFKAMRGLDGLPVNIKAVRPDDLFKLSK